MTDIEQQVFETLKEPIRWTNESYGKQRAYARLLVARFDITPKDEVQPNSPVLREIAVERGLQILKGWTPEHDDEHGPDHLVGEAFARLSRYHPLDPDRRKRLRTVAALLVAAIETIDREEQS